ncbi:MAG: hypothetical protein JAZ05_04200, partial [Candidatus Thiodiazotropha taylori]|nr:hypothetical protein [Candidatus Thiodiazotropha taylori]MCW4291212.1 hypothetical protein [Candidatus Thiodiazotropha taylori]
MRFFKDSPFLLVFNAKSNPAHHLSTNSLECCDKLIVQLNGGALTMQTVMPILALDQAGNPSRWLNQEKAIHLIATDR